LDLVPPLPRLARRVPLQQLLACSYAHANHCGTDVPADAFAFACTVDDSLGSAERPDICA
jgi:hypothetical protein